jgi:N-acetylglucosamine kinase-like BadF-type ATPase
MILGIDVGGTKTHIRVADATASRDLRLPTVQWLRGRSLEHPASVAALLEAAASIAPDGARLRRAPLVVGAHGCDTPEQIVAFRDALAADHDGPILVTNDAALVGPAAGVDRSIGIIAGTGSIVVGADADGTPVTAGGHGWMIADPASAPGIVREAVRTVILRADTGAAPDQLGEALMSHYGADDVNELAWVFMVEASIHRWAEAAPIVFEAADLGSADAVATIDRAAAELVTQVTQVLARGAVADAIVAAGGVVTHQPRLASALERELARQGVVHPFQVLDHAPVAGAIALGARLRREAEPTAGTEQAAVPEASALT